MCSNYEMRKVHFSLMKTVPKRQSVGMSSNRCTVGRGLSLNWNYFNVFFCFPDTRKQFYLPVCTNFAPLSSIITSLKAESDCFQAQVQPNMKKKKKQRSVVICQPRLAIKQCGRKTGSDTSIAGNDIDQRKL